jgi:hypothetical protein
VTAEHKIPAKLHGKGYKFIHQLSSRYLALLSFLAEAQETT